MATGLIFDDCQPPYTHYVKPVIIEDGVWLASGCMVMPGVRVGRESVVLAGAVVVTDVPPYTVVGGVPAKPLRMVKRNE